MNTSTGKETWAAFGLGGLLLANLPTVPAEHYMITLLAGCLLTVLAGAQRTFVKWLEMKYRSNDISIEKQANQIEEIVRGDG